ncbi:DUF1232 domain-containing protein [Zavarzinella formosa]|nr:DUF1232 domain-containing protein [Zavarzinella formosa]
MTAWARMLVLTLSPIDFIPDVIPVLGWIDDVVDLVIGVSAMLKKTEKP